MINSENLQVINAIRSKMALGKVIWTNTSSDSQFRLLLNSSTIVIDNWTAPTLGDLIRLDIIDNNGNIISRIMYIKDKEQDNYFMLMQFYNEVREYYKNTTRKELNKVVNEINTSETIGRFDEEIKKK